jgi:hypothetical protein
MTMAQMYLQLFFFNLLAAVLQCSYFDTLIIVMDCFHFHFPTVRGYPQINLAVYVWFYLCKDPFLIYKKIFYSANKLYIYEQQHVIRCVRHINYHNIYVHCLQIFLNSHISFGCSTNTYFLLECE